MITADTIIVYSRILDKLGKQCLTNRASTGMRSVEPYALEGFLTLCSFWAAYVLYHPPSNFASFPAAFAIAARMQDSEPAWGTMALVGALTKFFGLFLAAINEAEGVSFFIRCIGLIISGIFWSVMGTSIALGNTDSLFGIPSLLLGGSALWVLIRLPATRSDHF